MRVSRPNINFLLSLLLILFSITVTARAADDDEPDEYDVKARVVRISLIDGEVNLKRNGNQDWERIRLNYPLVEGDTVATDKDSRLEIQFEARNFVRLSANSVLRIVTLRDEGIALSVLEGTATLRLAKFDRSREYFEIDAPKTTVAAEKTGLYRIDVPREGRVRLTVRDGGSARIYSDTSGFALREGRSAELVVTGDNAGDWEFLAAVPDDAVDDWVNERERYLAQRSRYDVKYYDEYIWGAEDLEAYGDWGYTNDFGWIWRPRATAIADWAPYRFGHWTWVSPYGWTWVGYEPWGWAPYHYGRWVFHDNYWAWVPRSKFDRNRSWWRPALVAFVLNISFGNDVCWYPLSYYQRDPHSRHYRHDDRRPGYGGSGGGGGGRNERRYDQDKIWRGVTRVPRRDFGDPDRRGRAVDDERIARRVVDSAPQNGDLPRFTRTVPGGDGVQNAGRPGRRIPVVQIPERPTGATERAPGVALDEELRRSRVFRGREPRPVEPPETTTTPVTEAQPTGAVVRPEPEVPRQPTSDDPGRVVRPMMPNGIEKRERNRVGVETNPRTTPEPRNEPPAPVIQPSEESRPEPRSEPKSESPRPEPRSEPRESPKAQPRWERPEEPRSEPSRSESPRSEPARSESPRSEGPRSEPTRSEPARSESPRSEAPRSEPTRSEPARSESPRSEAPRSEPTRSEPARSESPRSESPRSESPKSESPRSESPRSESPKPDKPDRPRR
jgi:FecR protein